MSDLASAVAGLWRRVAAGVRHLADSLALRFGIRVREEATAAPPRPLSPDLAAARAAALDAARAAAVDHATRLAVALDAAGVRLACARIEGTRVPFGVPAPPPGEVIQCVTSSR